ncbi:MAG: hypothetical protein GXX85_15240 [Ignavibacteria bacterium]|nr:hypothetical protein [Ignavibacteria bacterium]
MTIKILTNWLRVLTNIFNKNFNKISSYPRVILPHKNYILNIDFDKHILNYSFLLVRRTNKKPTEAFDEIGFLKTEALISELKDVPDMSLNLLGGLFKENHLKYVPKGNANKQWTDGKNIRISDFIGQYKIEKEVYPIYFILKNIHNCEFPFSRKNDVNLKNLLDKLKIEIDKKPEFESEGKTSISHVPINLNYWHIEFHIKDKKVNQDVKRSGIKTNKDDYWQNRLAANALNDILIVNAKKEICNNEYDHIPKRLYKKNLWQTNPNLN